MVSSLGKISSQRDCSCLLRNAAQMLHASLGGYCGEPAAFAINSKASKRLCSIVCVKVVVGGLNRRYHVNRSDAKPRISGKYTFGDSYGKRIPP